MTTLRDLYRRHHAIYGSVPPLAHANTCPVCLGVRGAGYARCAGWNQAGLEPHAGSGPSGVLVPLSTAFEDGGVQPGSQSDPLVEWYRALRSYKRSDAEFAEHSDKLVGMLGVGLHLDVDRLAGLLGGCADRVCVVPSRQERYRTAEGVVEQPLHRVVQRIRLPQAMQLPPTLVHSGRELRHEVDASAFACIDEAVRGERVVLIDDSLVTGGSAMSARACLLAAGAAAVVVVTAARIVRPAFAHDIGADEYLDAARRPHDDARWVRE